MNPLTARLAQYAAYHRDRRNVATHFVGIPMIVVSTLSLLSRPAFPVAGAALSPAAIAIVVASAYYLSLDRRYGLVMAGLLGAGGWAGATIAAAATATWVVLTLGLFALGWGFQFAGHAFEGKKPAFVDDLMGLAVGPLFLVAEASFALGLRAEVREAMERRLAPC